MKIKVTPNISPKVRELIYSVLNVLEQVGVSVTGVTDLRLQRMAEACLAIGQIKESFSEVQSVKNGQFLRTRDIIKFENNFFDENISSGSYDDIRRKDLKPLVSAYIAINSSDIQAKATNDSRRAYCLSDAFADLLRAYGSDAWETSLEEYFSKTDLYTKKIQKKRAAEKVSVILPSKKKLLLSYGEHNQLQKAIIETFLNIFGKGSDVLYVGDTSDKFLHREDKVLSDLVFFPLVHDELPDVVAYNREKNILFLIEAFNCTGQWDKTRLSKIKQKLETCKANIVYVTAFQSLNAFRKVSNKIAWETEVWIADMPNHMIHFNGWKFLELHK